jgi:hypothetical protein
MEELNSIYDDLKFFNGKTFSDKCRSGKKNKHRGDRWGSPWYITEGKVRRRLFEGRYIEKDFTTDCKLLKSPRCQ